MATSPLASSFVELARALHIATRQAGPLLGVEFDAESIADALWLAQWLAPTAKVTVKEESPKEPEQSAAPPVDISDSKKLDETKPDPTRKPGLGDPDRKPDAEGGQKDKANQLFSESSTGQRRASAIHVPAASALPGSLELARALRPFNRRRRAVNRWELDEEATAESIAQFRFIRPVLRAVSERWFDVALVADGALSMDPWRKTLNEFELLLNRHGAFRQVRRWRLIGEPEIALESGGAQSTVKALLDSRERTLILLATNGVAEYWNSPSMAAAMALWAKRAPVAIIQVFGSSQWPHTVIGPASRTVRAPLPGSPTGKFEIERKRWERRQRDGALTAVPILSLSPESIAQWANASMGIGLGGTPAVVFGYRTYEPAVAMGERAAAPDPLSLVQSFKTYASPQAFRLACYLAATTLTPPVMRIVQQEIALAPRVEHLAEVVASGLIERITPARQNLDPDEIVYDFRDGVRDVLLGALPTSTALEVRKIVEEALKQFIETQLGRSIESFRAFILDDRGSYEVPESARALVVIERSLLERFGFGAAALELKGPGLRLQGHRGAINAIAFNLDGSLLISASADRTIKIWDAGSGAALHTLIGHEESVTCLAFSADGQTLISSSRDGTVCAWNLWGDGQLLFQFDGGTGSVLSIARLSPVTGLSVAIAAVRSGLGIWNLASGLEVLSMNEGSIVYCVAASTDGTQLLTCQEGKVLLRSSVDMRVVRSLEHEQGSSRSAAFAPDGNVIASGSGEEIVVWETESGRQIRRFSTFDQQPEFAFSPDGKLLAASVGGQRVLVWNYRTGEEVYRLDHVSVSCLCFGRDSYALAMGSSDSSISLWDLRAHTSEPVRLTGRAKNPRTLYVIASEHPDDFAVKETITEGLISAGHRVVTDPAISPDAVITFDASAPVHFQVKAILAKSAAELISIFVPSGPSGEFEFDDRSRWQSSFDRLLKKLDELVAPGRLLGVPELPEPYWRRKELRNIPRFWMATIIAPEGSGRHTFAAAVAREPSIRRRYPGGIYWEPTTYPAAKEPVLLIIPRFRWVDFLRQQDGILGIGDEWFSESSLTVSVFRLPDLDRSEQLDFLGAYRPPPAVLTPALGRLALLARWRLITEQFGAERIAQWLENKSVPQEYGAEAMLVAVHCTLDLLSTEDRTVLEFLANDPKASLDDRARAADLSPGAVQHAIDTAASLNMLIASRAGGLRPEFRQVLSDVSDGAEPSDRLLFFLSYAHRDKVFARRFANLVVQQASQILGKPQVFADARTAPSMSAWDPSIISNLLRSDAVLFILSAAALRSGPVMQILHRSRSENIPTITLQIEHCEIPPEIAVTQLLDLSVTNLHAVDPFDERLDALVQSAVKLIVNASRSRTAQFHGESAADKSSVTEPFFDPERLAHLAQSEGYSRVLQTLYAQLKTSPEATKLYWKLLAAELRGEEDWSAWFAKIIEQRPTLESAQKPARTEAESRPSDPLWHRAMWAAAAWLNDPAFASEDAIAKLVGENDRLLELLSIGHSDTLTSRVAFYLAFRAKPSLDYVMLLVQRLSENSPELRHGRALYPWLRAVSWIAANHTGRDVLLLVEVDIGLVQKSFQLSSTAPPSLATECQRELSEVILPWLHLSYLANQLEKLLMDSSSETHTTVEQIQQFEINLSVADYLRLLSEPDLGRRMVAYVRLAAQPVSDPRIVPLMLNTLPQKSEDTSETTVAFALYWSLEAIAKAIASGQDYSTIVMPYRERLLAARESLPPNSEGVLLIDQILAAEPVALSGASDSSTPIQQFAILCSAGKDVNVPAGASGEWLFGELFHQALATIIQSEKIVTLQSIFDYISNEGKQGSGSAAPLLYLSSHPGLGQFPLLNLDTDFLNKPDESNKSNKRRAILISAVNYTERSEIHAKREAVLAITANLLHAAGNFDSTCLLGEQASKSSLLGLVHKSNEQAVPGDTLLLYFSGCRVEWDDGALRIFLADSGDGRPETAFTGPELATLIRQRNFTNNILVFDTEMAASFVLYFQS